MIRQSISCVGLCAGLFAGSAMVYQPAMASTLDKLAECRSSSTDTYSFLECVDLQYQESETSLARIEELWRQYIAAESTPATQKIAPVSNDNIVAVTDQAAETQESDASVDESGIIAIVSDETVSEAKGSDRILNISEKNVGGQQFDSIANGEKIATGPQAQVKRFELLPGLFKNYRDQRCAWEAGLFGTGRTGVYIAACQTWLNDERTKKMRYQLAEKRANDSKGTFYKGFYIQDSDGGVFQSCDRRQEWRITGNPDIVQEIAERYDGISRESLEMAYLELRGDIAQTETLEAGLSGSLKVRSVGLLRSIAEADCEAGLAPVAATVSDNDYTGADFEETEAPIDAESPQTTSSEDITVDVLGGAGFLYGYFTNWVSTCAVEQNSVCKAQTEAEYSPQGDWLLSVDRSLESEWRVRLIPTTSDSVVGRAININIDGGIAASRPVSSGNTAVATNIGLVLARGESARELISQMRNGQNLSVAWTTATDNNNELVFSLLGITRALKFFDQSG